MLLLQKYNYVYFIKYIALKKIVQNRQSCRQFSTAGHRLYKLISANRNAVLTIMFNISVY